MIGQTAVESSGPPDGGREKPLRLAILGSFHLSHADGREIEITAKKNRALLAVLALSAHAQASRERICELLWGDSVEDQARNNLRQSLTVLRKELGPSADVMLHVHGDLLGLRKESVDIDAVEFLAVSAAAGISQLRRGAELFRGELLTGTTVKTEGFDDWLGAERSRLKAAIIALLDRLASLESGPARVAVAQKLVELDNLREPSHRLLMESCAAMGDNGSALRNYEACRKILHEELGVEPAPETRALWQSIIAAAKQQPGHVAAQTDAAEPPRAERRAIVTVLTFNNISGDPEEDYFARGITEDIITELSRFRNIQVLGGPFAETPAAGHGLAAGYAVGGTVRKSGRRARISARLTEVATGQTLWAERFDREIGDIFDLQEEVAISIVSRLGVTLGEAATARSRRKLSHSATAYDYFLRGGRAAWWRVDAGEAIANLERAIAADPEFAQAHALLARRHTNLLYSGLLAISPAEIWRRAREHIERALELDAGDPLVHMAASSIFGYTPPIDSDRARYHSDLSVALNPNDYEVMYFRVCHLTRVGRHKEALDLLDRMRGLTSPGSNFLCECDLDLCYLTGDYDKALRCFGGETAVPAHVGLIFAACHALRGRGEEARQTMAKMQRTRPTPFDPVAFANVQIAVFERPEDKQSWRDGFRKAGLAV